MLVSRLSLSWGSAALAFSLFVLGLHAFAPGAFFALATPLLHASDATGRATAGLFSGFRDAAALTKQVSDLATENTALASENRRLSEQVNDLTALLGTAPAPRDGIVAGVIAHPPESPYDTLIFSAGTEDGVTLGMEAFGASGVPLGFVTAVAPRASKVTLFSAPGMRTEGWVGSVRTALTLIGRGSGVLRAEVSRASAVAVGDAVFVPGPGAVPVGSVVRVDSDPSSPTLILQIQPAANLYSVLWAELRDTGRASMTTLASSTPL